MAAAMNRERRVAALEGQHCTQVPVQILMLAGRVGESVDGTVARHVDSHGEIPVGSSGQIGCIVLRPVAPVYEGRV